MIGITAAVTAILAATVVHADETTYDANAVCNNDQLMRWFDANHGLWKKNDGGYYWWNSANMLATFADLAKANPNVLKVYGGVFDTVHKNAPQHHPFVKLVKQKNGQAVKDYTFPSKQLRQKRASGFLNDYYDDEGWWGLAWIAALDVTGKREFLDEAIAIWYDMKAGWNKHHCGGLPWNKNGAGPVSIANELYMQLGAAISNRVGLDQKNTYLGPARDAWNWFSKSGVIGPDNLIRDGVDANSCQPNGDTYTYNQGVILGGLVELWRATGELAWIDHAEEIAMAVTKPGSKMQDKDGILADGCDQDKSCQGINDGTQFKGVFARNLKQLHAVRPSDQYKSFLERNARSIWQKDLHLDNGNCLNGVLWGGRYVAASASSQSSALDCLNAAQAVVTQGKAFKAPIYNPNKGRADAVKEAFNFSWKGYVNHAFPHDSLQPVDNTWRDDRNGWGATAVDALSTAIIMENQAAVDKILDHISKIDFDRSATDVSFFETSIRYLGGMLSGYDLLDGPMSHLINGNKTRLQPVLAQAKRLADNLKVAYNTPSGININGLEFHGPGNIVAHKDKAAGIAGATLTLEWQRLSDLTGNPEYGNLNKKAVSYFLTPYPQSNQPFPGLIGQNFDPTNGHSLDNSGGWTGGSDSHYEYLLKAFVYNKSIYEKHKERWELAATSSMRFLASNPSSRSDLTFLAEFSGQTVKYNSQHLACFAGGNFIQGGLTLGKKEYIDFGLRLVEGCHSTYQGTNTGIGPDSFSWQDIAHRQNNPPADQQDRFNKYGFWIGSSNYNLRPEVVESYYYAYRATGDTKYQDWAWDAFTSVNSTCRTGSGFSALKDVTNPGKGFDNHQESYFLAEFLKYTYMIQADDADWQVKADQTNQFVFNTEAHPIRIANNARN